MTGVARLSSARAVKCTVKSVNERNPCLKLLCLKGLPALSRRKVGMTSNQRDSYASGYTHVTMGSYKGSQ